MCLGLPSINQLGSPQAHVLSVAAPWRWGARPVLGSCSWPLPEAPLPPVGGLPRPGKGKLGWQAVADLSLYPQTSLMANCRAPRRPWLASHMSTVFISLLCFPSFLGAAVFLCYAVWQ